MSSRKEPAPTPAMVPAPEPHQPPSTKASVGVGRQDCGAVGERAACQVAVSVRVTADAAGRGPDEAVVADVGNALRGAAQPQAHRDLASRATSGPWPLVP
ncbi:hypothetical protein AB0D34_05545 [Streptomyces sp. NPDC048420]|uniref:hypothetical protein n=1 Tax=Streptomyces sp. NPDC048420 TaxID=3155755 RepID=UPI003436130F